MLRRIGSLRPAALPAVIVAVALIRPLDVVAHGDVHDQIVLLSKALEADPHNAILLLRRADLHRLDEDWEAALADCEASAAAAPGDPGPDWVRGRIHLAAGRATEAEASLTRFLMRRPEHVAARVERAVARTRLGRSEDAVADYSRAISLAQAPDPDWYLQRSRLLSAMVPPRLQEATRGLDEGIRKLGPLVVFEDAAADLEVSQGRFEAALQRIDRCARRAGRNERWHLRRGEILAQAGRTPEARAAFEDARSAILRLAPALRRTPAAAELEARLDRAQRALGLPADHPPDPVGAAAKPDCSLPPEPRTPTDSFSQP